MALLKEIHRFPRIVHNDYHYFQEGNTYPFTRFVLRVCVCDTGANINVDWKPIKRTMAPDCKESHHKDIIASHFSIWRVGVAV